MTPHLYNDIVITPALKLFESKFDTPEARAMLIAIALQESRLQHRKQIQGPARGFHQFETGGVSAVLTHKGVGPLAIEVCKTLVYTPLVSLVHVAFEHNDLLDCAFSRLLLYADPRLLPKYGQHDLAWAVYLFGWRPGKPHRQTWDDFYDEAWSVIS